MNESSAGDLPGQLRPPSVVFISGDTPADAQARACSPPNVTAQATPLTPERVDATQELDLWWGSYSGWTMLPSFLVCLLLTGGIGWFGFTVARPMAQTIILGASGLLWLVQLARWSHRFFSFNYRLTTRRVFIDRGFLFPDRLQVELGGIVRTDMTQNRFERLMGIGKVRLCLRDKGHEILVLAGVKDPQTVVGRIEEARLRKK
jgi:membrane protein YdbS with pleckstrin-like domain